MKRSKKTPPGSARVSRAEPPSPLRGEGYAKPRPSIGPDNAAFWQGCRQGHLLLPFCRGCGKAHLPPGPVCPFCFAEEIEWRPASGRGRISTRTRVHKAWFPAFAGEIPYNVVQVELDEGPRLTSQLVGTGDEKIAIGARVKAVFTEVDADLTLHAFRILQPPD
jgi:uncharacterized OB-fold protein